MGDAAGEEPAQGTALTDPYTSYFTPIPVRPGSEQVVIIAPLDNRSDETVVLESVRLAGEGLGSVVAVKRIEIAPLDYTRLGLKGVGGGIFGTYPPVASFRQEGKWYCARQELKAVNGFRLAPGRDANVLLLLRARKPGRYQVREHVVSYTVSGSEFVQSMPVGTRGEVKEDAKGPTLNDGEPPCLSKTRLLPGVRPMKGE